VAAPDVGTALFGLAMIVVLGKVRVIDRPVAIFGEVLRPGARPAGL